MQDGIFAGGKQTTVADIANIDAGDRRPLWPGLVIVVAGLLVYLNSFSGAFIFDDGLAIEGNPHIRVLWPITQAMTAPPQSSVAGRPIVSLSLALNHAFDGLNVRGYHAVNLAVHLLAGLLLYGIVRRTLLSERLRDRYRRDALVLAMLIAMYWVIHPLQTESVTYVIQRTESLAGCFYLLALYCSLRGATCSRSAPWHLAAVSACALGMATKEIVVTAPLVIPLYDRIFWSRSWGEALRRRKWLYLGLAAGWVVLAVIVLGGPRSASAGFGLEIVSPREYAQTQPGVILHYLKLCIWPSRLCLDYHWPVAKTALQVVPQAIVIIGLLGATVWALFRRPELGFSGAWFFLILSPTSSFVPILDLAFEHRAYLSSAAVVALVILGGHGLLNRLTTGSSLAPQPRRLLAGVLVVVVAGLLGYRTYERNRLYLSAVDMWRDVLSTNPDNPRAHNNLATHLIPEGRYEEAIEHCAEAIRLSPLYLEPRNNLAVALIQQGKYEEGIEQCAEVIRLSPHYSEPRHNIGVAQKFIADHLADQGKHAEAVQRYREALCFDPDNAEVHNNFGISLRALGQIDQAIQEYQAALRINPKYANAMISLGNALRQQGNIAGAVEQYRAAISADTRNANARLMLGTAYFEQKKLDEAIQEFRSALQINPTLAQADYCMGLALDKQGHAAEAVQSYRQALAKNPNHAEAQRALDAALQVQRPTSTSAPKP